MPGHTNMLTHHPSERASNEAEWNSDAGLCFTAEYLCMSCSLSSKPGKPSVIEVCVRVPALQARHPSRVALGQSCMTQTSRGSRPATPHQPPPTPLPPQREMLAPPQSCPVSAGSCCSMHPLQLHRLCTAAGGICTALHIMAVLCSPMYVDIDLNRLLHWMSYQATGSCSGCAAF